MRTASSHIERFLAPSEAFQIHGRKTPNWGRKGFYNSNGINLDGYSPPAEAPTSKSRIPCPSQLPQRARSLVEAFIILHKTDKIPLKPSLILLQ